jgi:L-lactate utilization protein LutB
MYDYGSGKNNSAGAQMTRTPGIIVVEPSAEQSKYRAAEVFARKQPKQLKLSNDIESVKEHLRLIRHETRDDNAKLLERLKNTLADLGVNVTVAADGKEAASAIRQIAGDTRLASINKSNIVVNEIRPDLKSQGFETYLRYFTEFSKNFEPEVFKKELEDYWSLAGMHDRGLMESFAVTKKFSSLPEGDIRDYVVILGVNAISAENGDVFFLQHMSNISHDLEQAKKIILIVGLEKVAKDSETALFHTRSMGIFGLESILLDLKPNDLERFDFNSLPVLADHPERSIDVIILDNGRSKLLNGTYEDLFLCIDCRNCARQCPIGLHVFFERGLVYSPKNYLLGFLQGFLPPVDACLHCGRCHVECPVEIDIPTLIWKAQLEHYEHHKRSLKKRMLDDPEMLAKMGTLTAPLSNWMVNIPIVQYMTELLTGVHRNSHLPTFHRETFRDWLKGGKRG